MTLIVHDKGGDRVVVKPGGEFRREAASLQTTEDGIGSVAVVSGLSINAISGEQVGQFHKTILTLAGVVVVSTDETTNGAHGSVDLYLFPRGNIYILGGSTNLALTGDGTGVGASAAVVGAVGSVAAAADATLSSTEGDMIPSVASTLSSSLGVMKGKSTTPKMFDNTTTTNGTQLKAKLNFAMPDAGTSANGTIAFTGTVELWWANLGDN